MHRTQGANGPWPASRRKSDQAEGGWGAGETIAHLAAGREQRQCCGHCKEYEQWRLADETTFRGCPRRAIELQAQIALRGLVAGRAVEAVRQVRRRRKEQRDERKQGDQALAAQEAHSGSVGVWRSAEAAGSVAAGRHPGNSPIIREL